MTKQEIVERILKLAPAAAPEAPILYTNIWRDAQIAFAKTLAETAVVVSGVRVKTHGWAISEDGDAGDTHTGLLVAIEPIKRVDPLVEKLRNWAASASGTLESVLLEAADRIEAANANQSDKKASRT